MKRLTLILTVLLISTFMLVACSDDKDEAKESDNNVVNEENNDGKDNDEAEKDDNTKDNDDDSGKSTSEITTEDQLDLKLGDTGKFDTTLGTYEMTVTSAKIIDSELDGNEPYNYGFILLDITIKNTSNHDLDAEDLMISMEVTDNLDGSGHIDSSGAFESVQELEGTIKPGEELSGQFITDIYESDEYYFREDPGNVAAGGSNQVIWTIPADEAK
ncbi:hypothetical protein HNQ35_002682 [Cerasibacillus quisquiliarum]|uniref:DUF4352 domain-containing protein n=1 Tax=Cerasibacillus quisquiliarum TaxID=227865 RepID=UPI001608105B|nr:DUF4352 domain-containing protein [Cerasibacillus quisquiliarum]MBB5147453.1 hypothetical protein [Cerasibacillus quisquiliarum]